MWRLSRSRRGARAAPRCMRLAVRIALLLGLAVMVLLIAREGPSAILTPLARAGWVLLWLVPLHALPLLLDVLGWRALITRRTAVARLFWIATVREAINRLLPVANIGGEIAGIRLLLESGDLAADVRHRQQSIDRLANRCYPEEPGDRKSTRL